MKKSLAIVISMAMIVAMMPMGVFADEIPAAKIGDTTYPTLQGALSAAKTGQTVIMLKDYNNDDYAFSNKTRFELNAGVTLDGNGYKISGNSDVEINAAGGTVQNVHFENIHDGAAVSDSYKEKYGFSSDKVGTASALYASKLTGTLTVKDCTFNTCDWEALQITPKEGATVNIISNEFKTADNEQIKEQLRHIHVEMAYGKGFDCEGENITLNINDNKLLGNTKEASLGVWWVGKKSTIDITGNYYQNIDAVSITLSDKTFARENRCDLVFPARAEEDVDNDNLSMPITIIKDAFNQSFCTTEAEAAGAGGIAIVGNFGYKSIETAIAAVANEGTVRLIKNVTLEDRLTINTNKTFTIDLGGKTLTGRTDIKQGNVTIKNGTVTNTTQPLNVYGSTEPTAENYSVLSISKDVNVSASDNVVCMMNAEGHKTYGAVINIEGNITATGTGNDAAVFVSGNIGNTENDVNIEAMSANNIVNIAGAVTGGNIMAVAMNGQATVNVKAPAKITGLTGIGVKRGILNVDDGATVEANGDKVEPAIANMNGAENTGAAISVTSSYNGVGSIGVNVSGGTIESKNNAAFYIGHSKSGETGIAFAKGMNINLTGGKFVSGADKTVFVADKMEGDADTYTKAIITGGTFSTSPKSPINYVVRGNNVYKLPNGAYVVAANGPSGYTWTAGTSDADYDFIGTAIPYTPSTPTDNVTNNTTDKNTTADLAPAVKDNKAETTVDAKTADKIVEKALENKSEEIIVDAAGNNTVASSEVGIPEKTVKEIAEKTDAKLVIKTDNGKVDLDKTAVKAVADQAGTTGTVKLIVETVKNDADICHVNLKLVTSNGAVTDFKGGNVKVTINLTKELAAKELVCVYIDDNGIYTLVEGVLNADGTYTFTTGHFSEYAVMAKAEADKKIAEQLNTLIKEVNLKVRTSKTSKKNIKAVVSGDVKALTDAGYTVKYKFYRSEKKASKYEAKATKAGKTYINTAGKKGTKYYYKAKALVYDGDKLVGQTVLTQCKYGVRTWSK